MSIPVFVRTHSKEEVKEQRKRDKLARDIKVKRSLKSKYGTSNKVVIAAKMPLYLRKKAVAAEKRRQSWELKRAEGILKRKKEVEKVRKARQYSWWGDTKIKKKKQGKTLSRKSRIRII